VLSDRVRLHCGVEARTPLLASEFQPPITAAAIKLMINDHDAPTGRPTGALAWAGLANLYFWIDRKNGVGGFWATQILPFADPASAGGYIDFETAVYGVSKKAAA
jgi:methyl acetate hydrolase